MFFYQVLLEQATKSVKNVLLFLHAVPTTNVINSNSVFVNSSNCKKM